MLVASDDATSGSVIANAERISPSSNGLSHMSCCSALPNSARISMFPVSGAAQFIDSGARKLCPLISASGAYSRFVNPGPQRVSGRNRFHSPRSRAFSFSSSITGGWNVVTSSASRICARYTGSAGYTAASMNSSSFVR